MTMTELEADERKVTHQTQTIGSTRVTVTGTKVHLRWRSERTTRHTDYQYWELPTQEQLEEAVQLARAGMDTE